MHLENNKKICLAFLEAIRTRNREAASGLLAEDGHFWLIGTTAALAKPAFLEVIDRLWTVMEGPTAIEIHQMTAEEDRVSIVGTGRMISKTGKPYENTYHILGTVKDGRIQSWREYFDMRIAAQAFR